MREERILSPFHLKITMQERNRLLRAMGATTAAPMLLASADCDPTRFFINETSFRG